MYEDDRLIVSFAYDALGRRLYKYSRSKYRDRPQAGPVWNENARVQRDIELGCGFTWYVWEDDSWNQDKPLTAVDAKQKIEEPKGKLSK
ncbi:Rhs family protein [Pseudomonas sp. S37]|uniref:hypothetical protein n=1 Tax=Pseudomonas sp. S37 TaxID=2767449 RepID=UPI0019145EED|nr:hypothetical protein [Pseudomonas sp. S37]MBK4996623.1 Rhs family protein [Pseudomonas sp. S37]